MTTSKQKDRELEIFRDFAAVSTLDIDMSSIESRDPPEPDVFCLFKNGNSVYFELTELIDKSHMERISMMSNMKEAMDKIYQNDLSPSKKNKFDGKYKRAHIHIDYSDRSSIQSRKAKFYKVIDILINLRESLSEFTISKDSELLPEITRVHVKKKTWSGPLFDTNCFGWLGDPTEEALLNKFKKTYSCNSPIELLAHIEWDLLPPGGAWKAAADRAMVEFSNSNFKRVWIFNSTSKTIEYIYPDAT